MVLSKKVLLVSVLVSLQCTCHSFQLSIIHPSPTKRNIHILKTERSGRTTILFNSKSNDTSSSPSSPSSSKQRSKGIYSRPSAAIERGSGFFVPGLEGSKVRIVFGALVLILNAINHQVSVNAKLDEVSGFALSEKIATFYGIFLLFQGLIEFAKEIGLGFDGVEDIITDGSSLNSSGANNGRNGILSDITAKSSSGNIANNKGVEQFISPTLAEMGEDISEGTSWVAATYLSLTPATHVMLLSKNSQINDEIKTLYRLGNFSNQQSTVQSEEEIKSSIEAAVDTVFQSKGGRVSIPSDHPGAMLLPEEYRRCLLLQQVDTGSESSQQLCLLVGSDQLLATYTKNDLKWLGFLGRYLADKC